MRRIGNVDFTFLLLVNTTLSVSDVYNHLFDSPHGCVPFAVGWMFPLSPVVKATSFSSCLTSPFATTEPPFSPALLTSVSSEWFVEIG